MGFAGSADNFQAEMGNLMATLEYIRAYIDNLLVITKGSLDDHLDKLKKVFIQLRDAGLKINATKSDFCAQETEYLGYILTRGGIKPQPKKVQAILVLNPPNNVKELQQFLGMVQYYRDTWRKHSKMLDPLTNLVGECGETKTTKKNKAKKKSVITQGNRPITFVSRKLSVTQTKYSVTKIKLLVIVETIKEFQGMLWGQTIKAYTDHKYLTQDAFCLTSDRVSLAITIGRVCS
jgi:hypothetical protein